jgi:hypothetical protein
MITHLTTEQHQEAARLLNQAQDNLDQLSRIVSRARYTDQALRIGKAIQELLIDPLREGWDADPARIWDADPARIIEENPYQSVGYHAPGSSRFMRRMTV